MQQFMLHKAAQEERANKYRFDRLSSPTFHPVSVVDAFEADRSDFSALAQQVCVHLRVVNLVTQHWNCFYQTDTFLYLLEIIQPA